MIKQLCFAGILATTLGCSSDKKVDAVAAFEGFTERVCACKDVACSAPIVDEMKAWLKKNEKSVKEASEAEKAKFETTKEAMSACVFKITSAPIVPTLGQ